MHYRWMLTVAPLSVVLLAAADQPWKDKQIPDWTDDDAKQILADSPWAKTVTPTIDRSANSGQRRGGGMGRGGGIGLGGIGLGIPGIGMGRRYPGGGYPGGGYPGGGYPGGGYPGGNDPGAGQTGGNRGGNSNQPPDLKLRWESAQPVRAAELKTHDADAPTVDENHYAIAVYGVPRRFETVAADSLKKQAALKRDGKKDLKPASVQVLQRDNGPVIVYLFPKDKAITAQDKRVEFDAKIGRLAFTKSFFLDDMMWQDKLAL